MGQLRTIIRSRKFQKASRGSKTAIPFNIGAEAMEVLDLSQLPHLLVAGAVMSGKTEFINYIIASLSLNSSPDEVNLLLIDTTKVELVSFNGIPHLVRPVVVDVEGTVNALHWIENEIEVRRSHLKSAEADNISIYNSRNGNEKVPCLVVVIYELSDMMSEIPEIAEPLICRIAESSPPVGIHMIIATQRPAEYILTSAIKRNFPVRLCFALTSRADSMLVLDKPGAAKLQNGEAIYFAHGSHKLMHMQGCSISDAEIESITAFLSAGGKMAKSS